MRAWAFKHVKDGSLTSDMFQGYIEFGPISLLERCWAEHIVYKMWDVSTETLTPYGKEKLALAKLQIVPVEVVDLDPEKEVK